jgi:formylglycine-generating enzyme required for sulfatase activity
MFKSEIPQELYQRVMNANPSRNQGRALPVDSVSWLDAAEFCERLSWLLGRKVRLPTEGEFAAAAAGLTRDMIVSAWSNETGGGRSHEVGKSLATAAGFFDLAGNLAEWLQPASAVSETAPVAGGSYLDPADTLIAAKVLPEEKRVRARHVGFRVVVESAGE